MRRKLTRNAARCLKCGEVIESTHRHDFKYCSCRTVMVDGGLDYARRGWPSGNPQDHFEDLSEYEEEPKITHGTNTGHL